MSVVPERETCRRTPGRSWPIWHDLKNERPSGMVANVLVAGHLLSAVGWHSSIASAAVQKKQAGIFAERNCYIFVELVDACIFSTC